MRLSSVRFLAAILPSALGLSFSVPASLFAQAPGGALTAAEPPAAQGSVWPSVIFSGLFNGPPDDRTHYLERYGVREGLGSNRRQSWFADVADLSLVYHDGRRDVVRVERHVSSRYNQHGTARIDTSRVRVTGGYGFFRQATSGLEYLFAPSQIVGGVDAAYTGGNVGYLGKFNDSVKGSLFAVTRRTYDGAFTVKPAAFADKATVGAAFHGIDRSGRAFSSLLTGGSDVLGTDADRRAKLRWHGYESIVDESASDMVFTAAVRPVKQLNIEYELGYERFRNDAPALNLGDVFTTAGIPIVNTTAEAGAAGALASASADLPAHFLSDSNVVRQSFMASAGNERMLLSAGAGWSVQTQETFTEELTSSGYTQGEIAANHAFVTVAARPSSSVRLEGYVRRSETNRRMDRFLTNIRLNAFTLSTYGAEAEVRPGGGRFSVTPGWTRRSVERDIEFDNIPEERSLYRAESSSDEIFVRAKWKLSPRFSLRATPAALWADKTAVVTEPERAAKLNLALSYASAAGTSSATAFYTVRTRRNDNLSFTGADGVAVTQDNRGSLQQLGASGAVAPSDASSVYWSYAWSRDEYSDDLISATTRRFDPAPQFYSRADRQSIVLGSHSFTLGADVAPAGKTQYGVSYTATRTAGDTASGLVLSALPAEDGRITNWYHTAALRMERNLGGSLNLAISYLLDYYSDGSYADLTGGLNTFIVGIGYRF